MLSEQPDEIIVVDYGCPDFSGDWVQSNFPSVNVVKATDDAGFCVARARNLGASIATQEWFLFIDADIRIQPGFYSWMKDHLYEPNFFYCNSPTYPSPNLGIRNLEAYGTVLCSRVAYQHVQGYDEAFRCWGGEDTDFYIRLKLRGFLEKDYPFNFTNPIPHPDSERVTFHDQKNRHLSEIAAKYYISAKTYLMERINYGVDLPLIIKESMFLQINDALNNWSLHPVRRLPIIKLVFSQHLLSSMPTLGFSDMSFAINPLELSNYEWQKLETSFEYK
jgi:hypothetical protein